ncbi:hypothetical protein VTJ04DRAFT_3860 [Mycothermus thermophilus]|uniref:uncharacterized protein n=1 Tax=Humicola insolens TaxID=85995 RepID=UPI0037424741
MDASEKKSALPAVAFPITPVTDSTTAAVTGAVVKDTSTPTHQTTKINLPIHGNRRGNNNRRRGYRNMSSPYHNQSNQNADTPLNPLTDLASKSPAEQWDQLAQTRPHPTNNVGTNTTQQGSGGRDGVRGGRGGGRAGRGGRGGSRGGRGGRNNHGNDTNQEPQAFHHRGGYPGGCRGRGRGGQNGRGRGNGRRYNNGWQGQVPDCPPEVLALAMPDPDTDESTVLGKTSLFSSFDGHFSNPDAPQNMQAEPDIRNQIGLVPKFYNFYTSAPEEPFKLAGLSVYDWEGCRPIEKDEIFQSYSFFHKFTSSWVEQTDCEGRNAHGIFDMPEHWKSDIDTNTSCLLPPLVHPETIFNTDGVDPNLDFRRQNFTANILLYKHFLKLKEERRKRMEEGNVTKGGSGDVRPSRIVRRGENLR